MKPLTIILLFFALQGIKSPAFAQRQPIDGDWNNPKCIEAVWSWATPTEEEKKFDRVNDLDLNGDRFSCFSQISATEINKLLSILKDAVSTNDKETLSQIVVYPFRYWIKTENPKRDENVEARRASNKVDFIEKYDQIITPYFRRFVQCATLNKFTAHGEGVVSMASGLIFFAKEPDNTKDIVKDFQKYPLRFSGMGAYMPRHDDWIVEHCQ